MPWINTKPQNSKDPKKKLYLFWYDRASKNTKMTPTPYLNTREGRRDAKKLILVMKTDLATKDFAITTGIQIKDTRLSTAFVKFKSERLLKKSSEQVYFNAYAKFVKFIGNKDVRKYTKADGITFIRKCQEPIIKDKVEIKLSAATIHTYTKHLKIMWDWFIESKLTRENIIKQTANKKLPVQIIPEEDLKTIFKYFKAHDKEYGTKQYFFVRFTYLTGFRPSTSLSIYGNNIKFDQGIIEYSNVKSSKFSVFPLHNKLEALLKEYKVDIIPSKKLFHYKSTDSLKFFPRAMKKLGMSYNYKTLRKTFGTLVANNISLYAAQIALDHENQRTTDDYYVQAMISKLKDDIDKNIKFE